MLGCLEARGIHEFDHDAILIDLPRPQLPDPPRAEHADEAVDKQPPKFTCHIVAACDEHFVKDLLPLCVTRVLGDLKS
jgi:hypothetical protein